MIIADNLHKSYKSGAKEILAVNGVSLHIKKADTTVIVGPSGAGKSTLLHLLGGLDRPTSGRVALGGVDIYKLSDRERALVRNSRIGFVFQFYHLLPEFTALENVMLPAEMKTRPTRQNRHVIRKKAEELLRAIGLEDRMDHKPGELSGGESQRVAIARALVNRPEMLLCDEPTGNLDSETSQTIYGLLHELKASSGMSLVIVTHDEKMTRNADRIIRIKDGKLT
jgi:lipoprotein-releasing system ATP-binding protein